MGSLRGLLVMTLALAAALWPAAAWAQPAVPPASDAAVHDSGLPVAQPGELTLVLKGALTATTRLAIDGGCQVLDGAFELHAGPDPLVHVRLAPYHGPDRYLTEGEPAGPAQVRVLVAGEEYLLRGDVTVREAGGLGDFGGGLEGPRGYSAILGEWRCPAAPAGGG